MSKIESFLAPAKLNLFLHILGKREDGLHALQTAFQFIDYCDEIIFVIDDSGQLSREDDGKKYDNDLILSAAKALQEYTGCTKGAKIYLKKRIPEGGGLGGGSSNAATTLVALNKLWALGLTKTTLAAIGLELGADVPVFVHGTAAWAEGVGEQLTACDMPENWFLVANPQVMISTGKIFSVKELTRDSNRIKICALSDVMLDEQTRNDCTDVVFRLYPEVAELIAWLSDFAVTKLTGTGACVFARFSTKTAAEQVLLQMPKKWQGFIAQSVNSSPLYVNMR